MDKYIKDRRRKDIVNKTVFSIRILLTLWAKFNTKGNKTISKIILKYL